MERMRENPKVREWWAMTDGFQEVRRLLLVFPFPGPSLLFHPWRCYITGV